VDKKILIAFVIGLALGVAGTGLVTCYRTSGEPDYLAGEYRESQQRTAETITGLERTIGEQRERIDDLETSNNRLTEHIRSARGISEQVIRRSEETAGDIRSAIALSKELADALKGIDRILRGNGSGGDSRNGVDNMEDL
jgi:predicted RNase H-like nuclease (RuvC/YqgF family)